jgi:hypothetical protein
MSDPFEPPAHERTTAVVRRDRTDVLLGFLAVPVLHVVGLFGLGVALGLGSFVIGDDVAGGIGMFALLCIGVAQVAWVGPFLLWTRRLGRPGLAQGALIAAAITFFLNAACWGLIFTGMQGRFAG